MALARSIRFKIFLLISAVVAAPVVVLSLYFPSAQIGRLEDALRGKAASFARMVGEQTKSALSFDDVETVREAFASAAMDEDVAFLGLYKTGGRALYVQGQSAFAAPAPSDSVVIDRADNRVRAHVGLTSAEGYSGVIVVEMSTVRVAATGAAVQRTAVLVGFFALVIGCVAAWLVGGSLGRRIGRVTARAKRVAEGDLSIAASDDRSGDEIGQLAGSFEQMVGSLRSLAKEIDDAAGMIDASTGMFLDMAREEEQLNSGAEPSAFTSGVVAGLTELGGYSVQLRNAIGRFHGLSAPPPAPEAPAEAPPRSMELPTVAGAEG